MITPEIVAYIKQERGMRVPDTDIRSRLLANGWDQQDIDEAFASPDVLAFVPGQKIVVSPEILKFRKDQKWMTFVVLMVLMLIPTVYSLVYSVGNANASIPFAMFLQPFYLIEFFLMGLVSYGVSNMISKSAMPHPDKRWLEVVYFLLRLVAAIILVIVLGMTVFFVTCLFLVSTGGFGGL